MPNIPAATPRLTVSLPLSVGRNVDRHQEDVRPSRGELGLLDVEAGEKGLGPFRSADPAVEVELVGFLDEVVLALCYGLVPSVGELVDSGRHRNLILVYGSA